MIPPIAEDRLFDGPLAARLGPQAVDPSAYHALPSCRPIVAYQQERNVSAEANANEDRPLHA
jgi:hypothetical protein